MDCVETHSCMRDGGDTVHTPPPAPVLRPSQSPAMPPRSLLPPPQSTLCSTNNFSCAMLLPHGIIEATRRGEMKKVLKWLRKGSIDAQRTDGDTLLHLAVLYEQPELLRELVKRGASVNLPNKDGVTVLMMACQLGACLAIDLLLQQSADVNKQTSNGGTALMTAAAHEQPEALSLLLAAGAVVDMQTNTAYTALMSAAAAGADKSTQLLLDARANPNLTNDTGRTALGCAQAKGMESTTTLLLTPSTLTSGAKLRFAVGDRVLCWCAEGEWLAGRIVQLLYREDEWPEGKNVPYQIKLDGRGLIYAPADDEHLIRAATEATAGLPKVCTRNRNLHQVGCSEARYRTRSLYRATGLLARAMHD